MADWILTRAIGRSRVASQNGLDIVGAISRVKPRQAALLAVLCVHLALAALFSIATPLWEAHDESGHYTYARYLALHGSLPPPGLSLSIYNETHQPPLYYWLIAPAIALADTTSDAQPKYTPLGQYYSQVKPKFPLSATGWVWVVPDPDLNSFPYRGTALAIHLGRLASALLSTLGVLFTYLTVRTLLPRRVDIALLAAGIHAVWPEYLFLSGAITNDVGIAVAGSLALWAVARLIVRQRLADYLLLALSLAIATLMKDSAVALVAFGGIVAGLLLLRDLARRRWRGVLNVTAFAGLLVILLLAGGWWSQGRSMRQLQAANGYVSASVDGVVSTDTADPQTASLRNRIPTLAWYWDYLRTETFDTLFAAYSHGFIRMPAAWYELARLSLLLVSPGLILVLLRRDKQSIRLVAIALLCIICVALAPISRAFFATDQSLLFGRFFLPGLSALVSIIAFGLRSLPAQLSRSGAVFVLPGIALAAILSPFAVIMPVYRLPQMLDPIAQPATMQVPVSLTYGNKIQLLGYSLPQPKSTQGGTSQIEFYWRALQPIEKDYLLRIEGFSVQGESFRSRLDSFPGHSIYPTSFWRVGDTFAEIYSLSVKPEVPAPTVGTFLVNWLDPDSGEPLAALCNGKACAPKVGQLPVALSGGSAAPWANRPAIYRIGSDIELVDFTVPASIQAGQTLSVSLVWRSRAGGMPPLTAFLHLLSPAGKMVAQQDSPPRDGYYPVNVWGPGEIIPDAYALPLDRALPAGRYRLTIGLYDSKTFERLPAFDLMGAPLADSIIPLAAIDIR